MEEHFIDIEKHTTATKNLVSFFVLALLVPVLAIAETQVEGEGEGVRAEEAVDGCDWELEDQEIQEQTREVFRSWSNKMVVRPRL